MKIRLISDLHLEFYPNPFKLWKKLNFDKVENKADEILILAGDIGYPLNQDQKESQSYVELLSLFKSQWDHIILVPGNHEYYNLKGHSFSYVDQVMSSMCNRLGIHFLQKGSCTLQGITFFGCTLWSNISLLGFHGMNDQRLFNFDVSEYLAIHQDHSQWLQEQISQCTSPCVAVTHHLPSFEMVHPRFLGKDNTPYATSLDTFIQKQTTLRLWCCGHTHERASAMIGNTLVYANPFGYPQETRETKPLWDNLTMEL